MESSGSGTRGAPTVAAASKRRRPPSLLVSVARTIVLVYALLLAGVFFFQGKLVWVPGGPPDDPPTSIGLHWKRIALTTKDGVALDAWRLDPKAPRLVVLFCHGNSGSIEQRLGAAVALGKRGCSTLLFDYRGYGKSAGSPSEEGTYEDAVAAYDWLVGEGHWRPDQIVVWGESLGGAVAVELALRRPVAALITESAFTSIPDVGARHYPWLPIRWLARIRYDSEEKAPRVAAPWLIVHSRADTLIPFEMAQRLHAAAARGRDHAVSSGGVAAPLELVETRGDHNDGGAFASKEATAAVERFLDEAAKRAKGG